MIRFLKYVRDFATTAIHKRMQITSCCSTLDKLEPLTDTLKIKSETSGEDTHPKGNLMKAQVYFNQLENLYSIAPQIQTALPNMISAQMSPMEWRTSPQAM